MKSYISALIEKSTGLKKQEIEKLIEIPPNQEIGDFAFPCFVLAKTLKKSPQLIAQEISEKIKPTKEIEKIQSVGPYINFFINQKYLAENTLKKINKQKSKYGSQTIGKGKVIVIDLSAPNIAKPFGIGHLRSTIIGDSLSKISNFLGYKTVKINYLGDWGTQFGKLITGYKRFGDEKKLKKDPINHLLELYVKVNNSQELEQEARDWFRKLENGDKDALRLWKRFRDLSIKEFDKIYNLLGVKFDVISGESVYNNKMEATISELEKKKLLKISEGAKVVSLEKYGLGTCLIKKSDGATLYATRDITAAIDRYKTYRFEKMIYEVGVEQKLHFKQFFKVLELMGHSWAKDCFHVAHGLYLGSDGKKFATRKGKTVFMSDVLNETINLAKEEISKREKLPKKELEKRARTIGLAAVLYGDLKNYREHDAIFDIKRFLSFEGNTGPYLLYTYARAKSILSKAKFSSTKEFKIKISPIEKSLITHLSIFPDITIQAYNQLAPNLIANYAHQLAQMFNEFYHMERVIGSENQDFKLALVSASSHVLKNALSLLSIQTLERM